MNKEILKERLANFKNKIEGFSDDDKFFQFIRINFDMDRFFILNLLDKNEIIDVLDNPDNLISINKYLSEILDEYVNDDVAL